MTIRKRLLRFTIYGSALVAAAAGGGVYALLTARHYLAGIQRESLPMVTGTSAIASCASDLTQQLGDLTDAQLAGDIGKRDRLNMSLAQRFDALNTALGNLNRAGLASAEFVPSAVSQAAVMSACEIRNDYQQLCEDWKGMRSATASDGKWDQALQLDDRAATLLKLTLTTQQGAIDDMAARLAEATPFINAVVGWTLAFAGLVVISALAAGAGFARRLASRIDRVRSEAKRIGAGDLTARLEVKGVDEIDQLAGAFNDMAGALQGSRNQLEHDALHDTLTGLPNRALFNERLERRFNEALRHGDHKFAVLFMDLDRFKFVNDSLGHAAGDTLLKEVATRLSLLLSNRGQSQAVQDTLCRLGGDEFTMLLENVDDAATAIDLAEAIKISLGAAMDVDGHELSVTASIGIAMADISTKEAKDLMGNADAALYRAKAGGRDGYAMFDASMRDKVVARLRIENDLRRALERHEFVLHFQPIFDLSGGELTGFESLIRWARGGELIRPDLFIPIAEETGQIVQIGEWVIEEACAQFQRWRVAHNGRPKMLSLNVSRRQLVDANLVPHLHRVLAKTGIEPSSLIVEITESMLGDEGASIATIAAIRALGVLIYVDDFGTGYSTLSSLHRIAIDGLKIDKSFVKRGDVSRDQLAVLNTVVQLAHNLSIPVIAEGIETPDQVALLQAMDCDRGQGFHFAKPMTAADAERLLVQPVAAVKAA